LKYGFGPESGLAPEIEAFARQIWMKEQAF
jgi:hypothetical protein